MCIYIHAHTYIHTYTYACMHVYHTLHYNISIYIISYNRMLYVFISRHTTQTYTRSPQQDSRSQDFRQGLGCSDMSFSLVAAKIFQGLGPKRRESSNGDLLQDLLLWRPSSM